VETFVQVFQNSLDELGKNELFKIKWKVRFPRLSAIQPIPLSQIRMDTNLEPVFPCS
jgi:hypothetical protein